MRLDFKKSMLAAGVLAALIAGSAFAATPEEDAAMQNQGHMYNNRMKQGAAQTEDASTRQSRAIKSKDGRREPQGRRDYPGEFHGMRGGNADTGVRGMHEGYKHHDGFNKAHAGQKHKLTDAQKQKLNEERNAIVNDWPNMTQEQRYEAREKFIERVNEEKMKHLTAEEKVLFQKRQAAKKAEREKLFKMTPEERQAYQQKKHEAWVKERTQNMSPEEKQRFLEKDKQKQLRRTELHNKWNAMTPEEKEQWRKEHPFRFRY